MNEENLIKELQEENEGLRKEKEALEKKVVDLEKQLAFFNNPRTPPSKQYFRKRVPQASKKLGAPREHKGATREILPPDETVKHFLTECPNCNDFLGKPFDMQERIEEEIPEPKPVRITKHIIGFYHCKNCGVVTANTGLPADGNFGKNILAHTALMKYDDCLPARKVVNTLNRSYLLKLTHSTVLNIVQRVHR